MKQSRLDKKYPYWKYLHIIVENELIMKFSFII